MLLYGKIQCSFMDPLESLQATVWQMQLLPHCRHVQSLHGLMPPAARLIAACLSKLIDGTEQPTRASCSMTTIHCVIWRRCPTTFNVRRRHKLVGECWLMPALWICSLEKEGGSCHAFARDRHQRTCLKNMLISYVHLCRWQERLAEYAPASAAGIFQCPMGSSGVRSAEMSSAQAQALAGPDKDHNQHGCPMGSAAVPSQTAVPAKARRYMPVMDGQ